MKPGYAALLSASALLMTLPAAAHHSVAINFEQGEPIEIRGTVKEVHMRNPHSQYVVAVPGEDGTVTDWFVEWSDRNSLVRRGVDLDLIKPGDTVTLTLWPSQRLPNVGYFVQAVLADGSVYRDCGFVKFREAVVNATKFRCEEGTPRRRAARRSMKALYADAALLVSCAFARRRVGGRHACRPRRRVAVQRRASSRGSRPHGGRPREARAVRSAARRHGHELQARDVHQHHAHALPADRNPAARGSRRDQLRVHGRAPARAARRRRSRTRRTRSPTIRTWAARSDATRARSSSSKRSTWRPATSTRSGLRACRSPRRCAPRSASNPPAIASRWS